MSRLFCTGRFVRCFRQKRSIREESTDVQALPCYGVTRYELLLPCKLNGIGDDYAYRRRRLGSVVDRHM